MVDMTKLMQSLRSHINQIPLVPVLSNQQSHPRPQSLQNDQFKDKPLQDEQQALLRLQYDFEFIQHLVSPEYVRFLFQQKYFDQPEFINYLTYLQYWKQPEYQKLLIQPRCLDVLSMLLKEEIRIEVDRHPDFTNFFSQ